MWSIFKESIFNIHPKEITETILKKEQFLKYFHFFLKQSSFPDSQINQHTEKKNVKTSFFSFHLKTSNSPDLQPKHPKPQKVLNNRRKPLQFLHRELKAKPPGVNININPTSASASRGTLARLKNRVTAARQWCKISINIDEYRYPNWQNSLQTFTQVKNPNN